MDRVVVLKQAIRWGIRCVPNRMVAYRLCSRLAPLLVRPLQGCDVAPTCLDGFKAHWLAHGRQCDARVILYFHGGGYVIGSNRTHLELAGRLAQAARAQVMMLEYRLAPENPFPAALEDAVAAYRYLLDRRVDASRIVLAGDSAGGGLAISAAMRLRDQGFPGPAGVVAMSPWLDLTCEQAANSPARARDPLISAQRIRYLARQYAGEHPLDHPGVSPFFGNIAGLPPLLVQVGADEALSAECEAFAVRARGEGVEMDLQVWPEMFHVWQFAAGLLPEGREALQQIGEFVCRVTPSTVRTEGHPIQRAIWAGAD
ncbi:alpha/beta hydrolase [Mangrovitalea sediminis]|uniref:alpha/beta hydrolase n=1 Tax=Mangrovitalea sediminis TaxID=1982043 RepID=UPI000BE559E6|nr:alpha/beta hydrolase [Mangrovitalea sediminis]